MNNDVKIAPIIKEIFYLTGAYGEPRTDHIHKGVDLATGKKSPVYSMANGTVILSKIGDGYGPYLIIKSESGSSYLYGDLDSDILVKVGDRVLQGEQIGYTGNPVGTTSTGLHVHMEQQNITNHNWSYDWNSGYFENPCETMGIPNIVNRVPYIYYGTPVPPKPQQINKTKFKWVLYARRLRKK